MKFTGSEPDGSAVLSDGFAKLLYVVAQFGDTVGGEQLVEAK